MGYNNDKENIYRCDIFRGKPSFDENCAAVIKLQHISKTLITSKTQED